VLISIKNAKKIVDFPSIYEKSKKKHKNEAKMNKKQLVAKISASMNLSKADAERQFDGITEIILSCLKGDEQVKIAGFGTYKVAKRKARVGRNPRTGEQIQIAASQKVKFLPAKALKEMFNK
jgi:DNA-binding protein HU-beta